MPRPIRLILHDSSPRRGRTSKDVLCGSWDCGDDSGIFGMQSSKKILGTEMSCSRRREIVEDCVKTESVLRFRKGLGWFREGGICDIYICVCIRTVSMGAWGRILKSELCQGRRSRIYQDL